MEQPLNIEELYREHYQYIFNVCYSITKNIDDAQDGAHDTFVRLFKVLSSFRGGSSLRVWMHRIAINEVLMTLRKRRKRPEVQIDDLRAAEPPQTRCRAAACVDTTLALKQAIASLAPGYSRVLTLHDIEGHEHHEVARILGLSPGTSKSQLHKARRKMREKLAA